MTVWECNTFFGAVWAKCKLGNNKGYLTWRYGFVSVCLAKYLSPPKCCELRFFFPRFSVSLFFLSVLSSCVQLVTPCLHLTVHIPPVSAIFVFVLSQIRLNLKLVVGFEYRPSLPYLVMIQLLLSELHLCYSKPIRSANKCTVYYYQYSFTSLLHVPASHAALQRTCTPIFKIYKNIID